MDTWAIEANPASPATSGDLSRRDVAVRLGGGALTALLLAAARRPAALAAQDASPVAATGVTAQPLGGGPTTSAPGLELTLRRITLAPGGRIPAHSHPGALVIFVEAGIWGYTALGGTAELARAGTAVAGTPAPTETMPLGTEVMLTAGDWIFVEDPEDDVRNAGADDVVLLVAGLTRVGEPFTSFFAP